MASQYFFFDGTAQWAQVQRPNKFGKYSINLIVDAPTRKAIKATGARLNVKETEDGEFFYTFTRKTTINKKDGTVAEIAPPVVIDKDGNPFDGLIGNGSEVTVKVEVYDFPAGKDEKTGQTWDAGKGTRLVGVQVRDLVEYKKEETSSSDNNTTDMPF